MGRRKVFRCKFCYNEIDEWDYKNLEKVCAECSDVYSIVQDAMQTLREYEQKIPPKIYREIVKQIKFDEVEERLAVRR